MKQNYYSRAMRTQGCISHSTFSSLPRFSSYFLFWLSRPASSFTPHLFHVCHSITYCISFASDLFPWNFSNF